MSHDLHPSMRPPATILDYLLIIQVDILFAAYIAMTPVQSYSSFSRGSTTVSC